MRYGNFEHYLEKLKNHFFSLSNIYDDDEHLFNSKLPFAIIYTEDF